MSSPDTDANSTQMTGVLIGIVGATLFGAKGIVIKLAMTVGATIDQLLAMRMLFSLPAYLLIGIFSYRRLKTKPNASIWLLACGLGVLSYHVCARMDFLSLLYISAQLERLVLFLYPTFVAILAWIFLGDRLTLRHVISLLLSYVGVFVLFGRETSHQGPDVILGTGLVLIAAVLFAIVVVASKKTIRIMGAALFTSVSMGAASFTILSQAAFNAVSDITPAYTPAILLSGLALAGFCTVIPSLLISEAISRLGPGKASAISGIGPVSTALLAVVILHEPFGWPHALALVMTMTGIAILSGWNPLLTFSKRSSV
ncbi:MAG: EamA family transporter [Hirschia sp.]|nr:EamA family transporter [Hirschia sp.]MBF17586.1 EamA family transporter [Hirschia sp.]